MENILRSPVRVNRACLYIHRCLNILRSQSYVSLKMELDIITTSTHRIAYRRIYNTRCIEPVICSLFCRKRSLQHKKHLVTKDLESYQLLDCSPYFMKLSVWLWSPICHFQRMYSLSTSFTCNSAQNESCLLVPWTLHVYCLARGVPNRTVWLLVSSRCPASPGLLASPV